MKKNEGILVWLCKMDCHNIFAQDAEAGKRHSKASHLLLIGPGGLQLVVSHLLQSQFQFYG
jgi:hypothetical protein